jgi:hypothetical protein
MILVRDIFHLKFGKAKDAKALLGEVGELNKKYGFGKTRFLSDLVTSQSYTFTMESEWNSLADWENSMKQGLGAEEFQKWYQKFIPLCDTASREILNIVDTK